MSSSRLKELQDRRRSNSGEPPATNLTVDKESAAFKFVQDAYATGKLLDLTSMTDQELAEYIAGQA